MALFSKLSPVHMSDDETDGEKVHPAVWRVIEADWMSQEFKIFLQTLDTLYRKDWANPIGKRRTPGNDPRVRRRSSSFRKKSSVAPAGLHRNCYDVVWLAKLSQPEFNDLHLIEGVWDLSIPEDIDARDTNAL